MGGGGGGVGGTIRSFPRFEVGGNDGVNDPIVPANFRWLKYNEAGFFS